MSYVKESYEACHALLQLNHLKDEIDAIHGATMCHVGKFAALFPNWSKYGIEVEPTLKFHDTEDRIAILIQGTKIHAKYERGENIPFGNIGDDDMCIQNHAGVGDDSLLRTHNHLSNESQIETGDFKLKVSDHFTDSDTGEEHKVYSIDKEKHTCDCSVRRFTMYGPEDVSPDSVWAINDAKHRIDRDRQPKSSNEYSKILIVKLSFNYITQQGLKTKHNLPTN